MITGKIDSDYIMFLFDYENVDYSQIIYSVEFAMQQRHYRKELSEEPYDDEDVY